VSKSVFDSLLRTLAALPFVFEESKQDRLDEAPYNSLALVGRCRLQSV
jgi:hypothetical protein